MDKIYKQFLKHCHWTWLYQMYLIWS